MKIKKSDFFSPVGIALLLGNLVILNLISTKLFGRLDFTENKLYTLSDVTKQILRELDEPLTVKAYFTRDLPAPYNNTARYVEDQLAEMKAYGRGKFRFELVDPADQEKLKAEAEKFRLEPIQVNEMKKDKVEFKLAYLGMVFLYEDKQEVIPAIQSLDNLEYEILSKIRRVTTQKIPAIGFLEGHGELGLRDKMTTLDRELRKLYELKPVNLEQRNSVPEDIDLLCIIGPTEDIPEKDQFIIDQYLMGGGKILFMANMVKTELQQMAATKGNLRIDNWTENYGFKINEDLILDRNCPTLPFQTMSQYGRQITMVTYPFFPEVVTFNRQNAAMKILRQVRLYFPSSIDTAVAPGYDLKVTPLMWTSDKAHAMTAPYDIDPFQLRGKLMFDTGHLALAVLVQGEFRSYFVNREVPKDAEGNPVSIDPIKGSSPDTRIVVIGDANMINDQYLAPGLDNLTATMNIIDWLAQDEALIGIRSRAVVSRPIGEVSDVTRQAVKYINLFIPPLLVIGFGLVRWRIRKSAARMVQKTQGRG
jgi:gliding-associated putative ABC transporter substrate-binding component GldG